MKRIVVVPDKGTVIAELDRLVPVDVHNTEEYLFPRTDGPLEGKAFYLSSFYDWAMGQDEMGVTVLVPMKKV